MTLQLQVFLSLVIISFDRMKVTCVINSQLKSMWVVVFLSVQCLGTEFVPVQIQKGIVCSFIATHTHD